MILMIWILNEKINIVILFYIIKISYIVIFIKVGVGDQKVVIFGAGFIQNFSFDLLSFFRVV